MILCGDLSAPIYKSVLKDFMCGGAFNKEKVLVGAFSDYCEYQCIIIHQCQNWRTLVLMGLRTKSPPMREGNNGGRPRGCGTRQYIDRVGC